MAKKKKNSSETESLASDDSSLNFEQTLAEVESIVGRLESGNLGLSESLEQYEAGIRQLKHCHQLLDGAEQRVSLLAGFDADGNPIHESMSPEESRGSNRKAAPSGRSKKSESTATDTESGEEQLF